MGAFLVVSLFYMGYEVQRCRLCDLYVAIHEGWEEVWTGVIFPCVIYVEQTNTKMRLHV